MSKFLNALTLQSRFTDIFYLVVEHPDLAVSLIDLGLINSHNHVLFPLLHAFGVLESECERLFNKFKKRKKLDFKVRYKVGEKTGTVLFLRVGDGM